MNVQQIDLDLVQGTTTPSITIKTGDRGIRKLQFKIYSGGALYTIPTELTVTLTNGGSISDTCSFSGSTVFANCTPAMSASAGTYSYTLVFSNSDGETMQSASLRIIVDKSTVEDADSPSEADWSGFYEVRNTVAQEANKASASATAAASSESNAATSETNAAASAKAAATSEKNAKTSETNASASANSASASKDSAASSASSASTSATNAKTSETNAATSAANAKTSETNASTSASTASTAATNASSSASAAASSATSAQEAVDSIFDKVYPVGSVYISVNSTSPATLFGGAWEQIQDRFLLGVGTTYTTVGETGGEASHTLTANELPNITGRVSLTDNVVLNAASGNTVTSTSGAFSAYKNTSPQALDTSVPVDSSVSRIKGFTMSFGGGAAHNNMPPYLAVYMWKRTA